MSLKQFTSLSILLICINISTLSQEYIKGTVIALETKIPVAFASVAYQKQSVQQGMITDSKGEFRIYDTGIQKLFVSCVGYERKTVTINPATNLKNIVIELKTDTLNIGEIVVTPANNPAIRIIRNVLRNKEKNNYENYDKYKYQCYFKTVLSMKISYIAEAADSSKNVNKNLGDDRARFISESVVLCSKIKNRTDNKLIAVKTSGFDNPFLGQYFFTAFHNSISFYNNNISLLAINSTADKTSEEYISPVSNECLSSYNYNLEETFENPEDTIYVIEFHPKRGSNFNSLKGKIYISSNGYAIKNIIVQPFEKGLIDFKFRQDYEFVNGKWFPARLDEEIAFVSVKINKKINAYPVYLVTSMISDVDLNPTITGDSINIDKVWVDKSFRLKNDSILGSARSDALTLNEKRAYELMGRMGKKYRFDFFADLYPGLLAGKIPVKSIDIDLFRLFYSNAYEGSRLGMGLSTNDKFSKVISVGGFVGYGMKDEKIKYGGHFDLNIDKEKDAYLRFSYQNNLKEPGLDLNENNSFFAGNDYLRNYIASRMDNFIEKKAEIRFRLIRHLKLSAAISSKEITPTYELFYGGVPLKKYLADDIQISASYAWGEEMATFGSQRVITYQGNPVLNIKFKRGIDQFHSVSSIYDRAEASIDISAYKGKLGQSNIRLAGGYIDKTLPYGLLFTGEGSKSNSLLVINNTFQTMNPYEFLSDRYISLFYSHNFGSLLFERPGFKPRIVIAHNTGWGTLENASLQGIDFKVKDKIYLESGLLINNLVSFKVVNLYNIGFGGGAFYRYGNYRNAKTIDNFALKFSIMVTYK